MNNHRIPLTLQGKAGIKEIVDGRLLIVTGGDKKEIIDLVSLKNIYLYSGQSAPVQPKDNNLVFLVKDKIEGTPEKEKHVYYKIFIDGNEEGRTETGVASLDKKLQVSAKGDSYHVIRLERWELHRKKRQYRRANNILQPRPRRIFLPENRIIRISVTFDGKQHTFSSETVME